MNVPSLQRLTVLSLIFHITFFGMTLFALKQSSRLVMPSPYIVNLVDSDLGSRPAPAAVTHAETKSPEPERAEPAPKKDEMASPSVKEPKHVIKKEEHIVQDRIAAMEAKKKIERIAKLRNALKKIVPLKGSATGGKPVVSSGGSGKNKGSVADDYYIKVTRQIWDKWGIPRDMKEKKLEAIVSIRIMRDGSVQIIGIEQRSGNSLFDRSALAAIKDASPLPPPPYEMEIGVRFYP